MGYGQNNPIKFIDISGKEGESCSIYDDEEANSCPDLTDEYSANDFPQSIPLEDQVSSMHGDENYYPDSENLVCERELPGKVHILIATNKRELGDIDKAAAETRKREILLNPDFDPSVDDIVTLEVYDLGRLGQAIDYVYQLPEVGEGSTTVELSVWGHSGFDGPRADQITTGLYQLDTYKGKKQMKLDGYEAIDFRWNTEESVAIFLWV